MEDHYDGADTKWKYLPEGRAMGIPYRINSRNSKIYWLPADV
jgi:hypothetical protein